MQFSTRVHVISADGKRITSIPGPMAAKQLAYGNAVVVGSHGIRTGRTEGKVRAIKLNADSPSVTWPCREVTVGSYMGTSYTRRAEICNKAGEVIGYQHELNKLTPLHAELFRQAVIDTTVQL